MICLAVTFRALEGREEEFARVLRELAAATRKEPGNIMYLGHRSPTDPRAFFLYEQYEDEAALQAHRSSAHFAKYATDGIYKLMESRELEIYQPL